MTDKTKEILAWVAMILWATILVYPVVAFLTMYIRTLFRMVVFLWGI